MFQIFFHRKTGQELSDALTCDTSCTGDSARICAKRNLLGSVAIMRPTLSRWHINEIWNTHPLACETRFERLYLLELIPRVTSTRWRRANNDIESDQHTAYRHPRQQTRIDPSRDRLRACC